jgi:ST7 protein
MNLSAQDHQTFFTSDLDSGKLDYEAMLMAWRERNTIARIKTARKALEINEMNACAYILLAEEEATTIVEAEMILKQALKVAEVNLRKSQGYQGSLYESQYRRDANVVIYIKRRLAMCARKLGKLKEAAKIFRDLTRSVEPASSIISVLNVHENLLECLLEMRAYADCASVLAKYDDISLPKSAAIVYTAALLKARAVSEKFSPEIASRRGLTSAELQAVEAIHRAVEFNVHVIQYLLEMKKMIFPAEHILKRGDSEALAVSEVLCI